MEDFREKINIEDYNYELPRERIAQYPVKDRDKSRLLLYNKGIISEDTFINIGDHLPSDSLLVFNNTRVIRARLLFIKETGAIIEIFCLEPIDPSDYEISFGSVNPVEWKCIIGNLKKWKKGRLTSSFISGNKKYELSAEKIKPEGEAWKIRFSWNTRDLSFSEVIEAAGHIPLPPYVKREDETEDNIRYQTVYSKISGSVAAPTAGLHFTDKVINDIIKRQISYTELTLHIGAGTFKPVRHNDISKHEMHCEHFFVNRQLVEMLLNFEGRIIAVGTTSVRSLESLYWLGVKVLRDQHPAGNEFHISQWTPYQEDEQTESRKSLEALLTLFPEKGTLSLHVSTGIMLIPGYRYRIISGMITNFHQPKSTLLLLVSAWTGQDWKKIYDYALENGFRFLSFGDSSLLLK